ncbi:1,2-phenylacetyl-CoA epoxidase subunit PaaE [Janibacter sp. GXQ6167]|uniref:1,2-phenylacetyl-CoA epoxidase subunit PaaE n=1 Tax=Janibacter sp. GXQ6167 TaxID=3240791 RepID=UPI0035236D0F
MTTSVQRAKAAFASTTKDDGPAPKKRIGFHVLKVKELDRITDDAVAITFEVPDHLAEDFAYLPGQHVAVRATIAGDDIRRNYSICAPAGSGTLRIGVKRLVDGVFSNYAIERLRVGDSLEVLSPSGTFTTELGEGHGKHIGAIAAGSGITPVLSILSTALADDEQARATLIFVNVAAHSIMFLEELEDLKNTYMDRFDAFHVLDGESTETELLSGRLDEDRLRAIFDGAGGRDVDEWFLCGPLPMTDMAREVLMERGVADADIHRELFHVSTAPPRPKTEVKVKGDGAEVTVHLEGRSTTFTLPPNTDTILDAARKIRSEVPYACKNGVCGTCRCKVLEGSVDMVQNYALEADEVDKGYVLACQSFPTSETVTVDFDV